MGLSRRLYETHRDVLATHRQTTDGLPGRCWSAIRETGSPLRADALPVCRLSRWRHGSPSAACSGEKIGGPSVKPHRPYRGLWSDVSVELPLANTSPTKMIGLYRRSMYTFWKRTCPPPGMTAFDAPDRETCLIRRARTNTPLYSLGALERTRRTSKAHGIRRAGQRTMRGLTPRRSA